MAELCAHSTSSNGSQHSSNSDAFASRPSSRRRLQHGGSQGTFRLVKSSRPEQTHYSSTGARLPETADNASAEWKPDDSTHPDETAKQEYADCRTCKGSLSTPHLTFRIHLHTGKLQETSDAPTSGLPDDVQEVLKVVNALLNDCGGTVCVHCSPSCPVRLLDRLLDHRLRGLIANLSLYEDNFERLVVDHRHVVYRIKPTPHPRISVFNFHSMISDNRGLVEPSQAQIQHLIQSCSSASSDTGIREVDRCAARIDFQHMRPLSLHPSCRVHLHEVDSSAVAKKRLDSYGANVISYWWDDLGLPKYIAALSKQQTGGSVYLGIAEQAEPAGKAWEEVENCDLGALFPGCRKKVWVARGDGRRGADVQHLARDEDVPLAEGLHTGAYVCQGLQLSRQEQLVLEADLLEKVRSQMLWYPRYPVKDPLFLTFHPVRGGATDLCVVEVVVSKFRGVVFHRSDGPEVYGIKSIGSNHMIRPLALEELTNQLNYFCGLQEESQA